MKMWIAVFVSAFLVALSYGGDTTTKYHGPKEAEATTSEAVGNSTESQEDATTSYPVKEPVQQWMDQARLWDDLFSVYNPNVMPPPTNGSAVDVLWGLSLIDMYRYDAATGYANFIIWEHQSWRDSRLSWDTNLYSVDQWSLSPKGNIWLPDILLYKSKLSEEKRSDVNVIVSPSGGVVRITAAEVAIPCEEKEEQIITCSFRYGSWTRHGHQLNLQLESETIDDTFFFSVPYELDATEVQRNVETYPCCPEPYIDLLFTVQLRRK